jgi:hypothetical protein
MPGLDPGIHRNKAAGRQARRFYLAIEMMWVLPTIYPLVRFHCGLTGNFGSHTMSDDTEILREIRDLLRLIAEPALAKRDERLRASLQELVGKSKQKAEVVVLMDGTRSQADIRKAAGVDPGNFSRLVTALREAELIGPDERRPKLVFPAPSNLIDNVGNAKK